MQEIATPPAILLTGLPGVGKTTVLHRLVALLPGWRPAGFYTEELRSGGRRQGFRAVSFGGPSRVIADVGFHGVHRVGAYGVDVAAIDSLSVEALAPSPDVDLYVVDEIGRMECMSGRFIEAVRRLLDSGLPLVGAVALRGGGFIAEVKQRPDVELRQVTAANRDRLPEALHVELMRWRGTPGAGDRGGSPGS